MTAAAVVERRVWAGGGGEEEEKGTPEGPSSILGNKRNCDNREGHQSEEGIREETEIDY